MRSSWIKRLLLGNAKIGCWYPNLVEDVGFDVGVGCFAIRTQIEVGTVRAMPPDTTYRLTIAAIAGDATVNDALMPGTILCNMIQCPLKCLTFGIAHNVLFPVASLGGRYTFKIDNGLP